VAVKRDLPAPAEASEKPVNRHLTTGIIAAVLFTLVIVWGAVASALPEGGTVLLAAAVDGLLAGVCIGALIGANFALAAVEKAERKEQAHKPEAEIAAAA
jgi:membrane associated rhomboid family serine protease